MNLLHPTAVGPECHRCGNELPSISYARKVVTYLGKDLKDAKSCTSGCDAVKSAGSRCHTKPRAKAWLKFFPAAFPYCISGGHAPVRMSFYSAI